MKPFKNKKRNPLATALLTIITFTLASLALLGAAVIAGLIKAFILPNSYTPIEDLTLPKGLLIATTTIIALYTIPALIAHLSEKARERKIWQPPKNKKRRTKEERYLKGTKPATPKNN